MLSDEKYYIKIGKRYIHTKFWAIIITIITFILYYKNIFKIYEFYENSVIITISTFVLDLINYVGIIVNCFNLSVLINNPIEHIYFYKRTAIFNIIYSISLLCVIFMLLFGSYINDYEEFLLYKLIIVMSQILFFLSSTIIIFILDRDFSIYE